MFIYEFILLSYNEDKNRTERKYGIVAEENEEKALGKIGAWYGDSLIRIEYFGCVSEYDGDSVYLLNDDWANDFKISGRKFKKIIPELNEIPKNSEIYE
jgi:hypothetical protein